MTNNLEKRVKEHNSIGARGAKYLRPRKPVILVYSEKYNSIQDAMKREREVKKLKKSQKEKLVSGMKSRV